MQLEIRSRTDCKQVAWVSYAVFCDNVEHFVEHRTPEADFSALHSLEDVIDGASSQLVDALELRREVLAAWHAVADVPLRDAAVSIRTRAIMLGCRVPPEVRGTAVASHAGWSPAVDDEDCETICDVAREFVAAVLVLTADAAPGDVLVVTRDGASPWAENAAALR